MRDTESAARAALIEAAAERERCSEGADVAMLGAMMIVAILSIGACAVWVFA